MSLGLNREYETEAICIFAQIVKMVSFDHPEDTALQAYCSKVKMTAIMMLMQDKHEIGKSNIMEDRIQGCRQCELDEKMRPCVLNGKHGRCKYKSIKYRALFIKKHFGEAAMEPMQPYVKQYEKEVEGLKRRSESS